MARDYGFAGFEIFDAKAEKKRHSDSVLRDGSADAKRKLRNRDLAVSAVVYPFPVEDEEADGSVIKQYVDWAYAAGIEAVIISLAKEPDYALLREKLTPAIERADKTDVSILLETSGPLAHSAKVLEIIRRNNDTEMKRLFKLDYLGEAETLGEESDHHRYAGE